MKIAILTHPLWTNYGGILQAYALQTTLQRFGHEVVVVNREFRDYPSLRLVLLRMCSVCKCFIKRYIFNKKEYILMSPMSPYGHYTKWKGYDVLPFVKERINHSKILRNSNELRKYFKRHHFDCYIVGSDQVWRPKFVANITDYFLKEVPLTSKATRIAYAASFGNEEWEFTKEETVECSDLLKRFHFVSVREDSGVKMCREFLGVDATHVLDPTLLLDRDDYIKLMEESQTTQSPGNVMCYILDESDDADGIISEIKSEGNAPFYLKLDVESTQDNPRPYQCSIEQWLRGFYDADLVVTDSFHACVFAILFGKPLIVLKNEMRGNARIESLMRMFDLQKCIVKSFEDYIIRRDQLKVGFDRDRIDKLLKYWRNVSRAFLFGSGLVDIK